MDHATAQLIYWIGFAIGLVSGIALSYWWSLL